MERVSNDITIKDEKLEPVSKPPEKQVTKSSPVDNKKSTLQKLQPILKSVTPLVTATAPKTVGEVLKNLPKGMVVKRPIVPPTATATTNEKKADPTPAVDTSPSPSTPKPAMVQKKLLPYMNAKQPPPTPLAKSTPIKPIETTKATTRSSSKRPAEDTKSPSPVKKVAVEATITKTSPSTTVPTPKPVLKPVPKPGSSMKKSKTFEMKIGDKMVKVQKVVMTKAEVAAMARDGKIEMQGDTMILKQGKAKK